MRGGQVLMKRGERERRPVKTRQYTNVSDRVVAAFGSRIARKKAATCGGAPLLCEACCIVEKVPLFKLRGDEKEVTRTLFRPSKVCGVERCGGIRRPVLASTHAGDGDHP